MMSLTAKWKIICFGCGKTKRRTEILNKNNLDNFGDPDGIHTYYNDPWGPGIPDGWIQVVNFEKKGFPEFFCETKCYSNWLRSQGRNEDADKFDKTIWIA